MRLTAIASQDNGAARTTIRSALKGRGIVAVLEDIGFS
jgi:hypothetical protein